MSGCRDCQTCTAPGAAKANRKMLAGAMHFMTVGISYVTIRAVMSHCPQCSHLMGRHQRRDDGSFRD